MKGKARQAELEKIKSGAVQMVVGTHALFQEEVEFADLALVIIDEQHRFGVHQRLMLREKGEKSRILSTPTDYDSYANSENISDDGLCRS